MNHELDLIHPYEKIFAAYSENNSGTSKRPKKNSLEIIKM